LTINLNIYSHNGFTDIQETHILWNEVEVCVFFMKEREESINNQTLVSESVAVIFGDQAIWLA